MTSAFWILGAALAALGLLAAAWALFWDRARGRTRCPQCWYDMAGVALKDGKHLCPECGRAAPDERALRKTRRHWIPAGAGAIVLALGLITLAVPLYINDVSITAIPRPLLVLGFDMLDEDRKNEAWSHLEKQLSDMAPWERRRAARIWTQRSLYPAVQSASIQIGASARSFSVDYWGPLPGAMTNLFGAETPACADELMRIDPSGVSAQVALLIDPTSEPARAAVLSDVQSGDRSICLLAHEAAHKAGIGAPADERLATRCTDNDELARIIERIANGTHERTPTRAREFRPLLNTNLPLLNVLGALIASPRTRDAALELAEPHALLERYFEDLAGGERLNGADPFLEAMLDSGPPRLQFASAVLLIGATDAHRALDTFRDYPPQFQREIVEYCANIPSPSEDFRAARARVLVEAPPAFAESLWSAVWDRIVVSPGERVIGDEQRELLFLMRYLAPKLAPEQPPEQRIRVADLFGRIGRISTVALPALNEMLESDDPEVRAAARAALDQINSAGPRLRPPDPRRE